jgi:hypothetical protein
MVTRIDESLERTSPQIPEYLKSAVKAPDSFPRRMNSTAVGSTMLARAPSMLPKRKTDAQHPGVVAVAHLPVVDGSDDRAVVRVGDRIVKHFSAGNHPDL